MQNALRRALFLPILVAALFSCQDSDLHSSIDRVEVTRTLIINFRGELVVVPYDFPQELFDQSQASFDRYYALIEEANYARKNGYKVALTYDDLNSILLPLIKKYPALSWEKEISEKDLQRIYKDFISITTHEQVMEKLEIIHSYYEALLRRDAIQAAIIYENEKGANGRTLFNSPSTLTEPEKNHLLNHPLKAPHYMQASADATQFTISFIDQNNDDGNKGNAFRHSAWNALAIRYVLLGAPCSKNEAIEFVRKGTSAHEESLNGGQQKTDNSAMDLHNNMSARRWMESEVSWGIGPFRKVPNVTEIINKMLERANSCAVQSKLDILNWHGGDNQNTWNHLYNDNTSSHQHLVRLK